MKTILLLAVAATSLLLTSCITGRYQNEQDFQDMQDYIKFQEFLREYNAHVA